MKSPHYPDHIKHTTEGQPLSEAPTVNKLGLKNKLEGIITPNTIKITTKIVLFTLMSLGNVCPSFANQSLDYLNQEITLARETLARISAKRNEIQKIYDYLLSKQNKTMQDNDILRNAGLEINRINQEYNDALLRSNEVLNALNEKLSERNNTGTGQMTIYCENGTTVTVDTSTFTKGAITNACRN